MAARCRISPSLTLLEFCLAASSASVGTTTLRQGAQQSPAKCSPFCAQSTMRGRSVPGWQTEPTWCSSRPVPEPKAFRLRFSVPAEVRRPQAGHLRRISASHGGPEPRATNGRAPLAAERSCGPMPARCDACSTRCDSRAKKRKAPEQGKLWPQGGPDRCIQSGQGLRGPPVECWEGARSHAMHNMPQYAFNMHTASV